MSKIFALAAVVVTLYSTVAFAQSEARIFFVKGKPAIIKQGGAGPQACAVDMPVDNGDNIKTGAGESVEISFLNDNSNVVKIEESTDAYIKKNEAPYRIDILDGAAMALIKKLPKDSKFEISTPVGMCGARGTGWRTATNGKEAIFEAFENSIYVIGFDKDGNENGEITINSGTMALLNEFEAPGRVEKIPGSESIGWNDWKHDLSGRLGQAGRGGARGARGRPGAGQLESNKLEVKESLVNDRIDQRQSGGASGGSGASKESGPTNHYDDSID